MKQIYIACDSYDHKFYAAGETLTAAVTNLAETVNQHPNSLEFTETSPGLYTDQAAPEFAIFTYNI